MMPRRRAVESPRSARDVASSPLCWSTQFKSQHMAGQLALPVWDARDGLGALGRLGRKRAPRQRSLRASLGGRGCWLLVASCCACGVMVLVLELELGLGLHQQLNCVCSPLPPRAVDPDAAHCPPQSGPQSTR